MYDGVCIFMLKLRNYILRGGDFFHFSRGCGAPSERQSTGGSIDLIQPPVLCRSAGAPESPSKTKKLTTSQYKAPDTYTGTFTRGLNNYVCKNRQKQNFNSKKSGYIILNIYANEIQGPSGQLRSRLGLGSQLEPIAEFSAWFKPG